ncbi:LuxR C-terminal-related transcriptional regulator [Saccharothrix sp. AJ9571]|nr:LuxR C-terminal-related transcriptional regulator [Saccharothrix sp. AJ9571]
MSGEREIRASRREREVLAALREHLANAEIAERLFISVRTVESHISSLLRKYGVKDRKELMAVTPAAAVPAGPVPPGLSSFVGRERERADLAAALRSSRLVTAVGPGGVGKTRLAQAVAAASAGSFADGVCHVDLVPVREDAGVAGAIAAAAGLAELAGRTVADAVLRWAEVKRTLLVLDNCEHVIGGVAVLVERLLAHSGDLRILATSRTPLRLPFENVYVVPGLSLGGGGTGETGGDALALFRTRAAQAGATVPDDDERAARICRDLDGLPLALELAAARLPATGLDGLVAGLSDRLTLLTGRGRADERHRSLRSALDWSHELLDEAARAVLRRICVFAGPFTVDAAVSVIDGGVVAPRAVRALVAELADWSLLTPVAVSGETRYRLLETVRQFGAELLADAEEDEHYRARHLRWARETALSAELRAALDWCAGQDSRRDDARATASQLAVSAHRRGMLGEAQRYFETAARFADDAEEAARLLRCAAGSAATRLAGQEALSLYRAAADAALRAGRGELAALDLAQASEAVNRYAGAFAEPPGPEVARALLTEARDRAGEDPLARARVAIAEAFATPETDAAARPAAEHALELAQRCGEPLAESAALDRLTTIHLVAGEVGAAFACAMRRTELLATRTDLGLEISDAYVMATETAIAAGDLATAKQVAMRLHDLPSHHELGHLATARLILVTALTGEWDESIQHAERFHTGWEQAGRPTIPTLRQAAHAAATVYGLRADSEQRQRWLRTAEALGPDDVGADIPRALFDALLLLHADRPDQAARLLATGPADLHGWYTAIWRPWYAALRAEAAVLSGSPDAQQRWDEARRWVTGNPIATALLERAAALAAGDRERIRRVAEGLTACRYQWARTLVLAGDADGEKAMAALGAAAPGH